MLKLYYTITKGEDEEQQKPSNSLGGYRSSNLFKNDDLNNAFGDISIYTVNNNNQNQYIALILKNEGSAEIENINLWFAYGDTPYSLFSIAVTDLSEDSEGFGYMENVQTLYSSPIYAEFSEATEEENKVNIGSLAIDEAIGLWIKREVLVDTIKADMDDFIIEDPDNSDRVVQKTLETSDTIEMKLSYD